MRTGIIDPGGSLLWKITLGAKYLKINNGWRPNDEKKIEIYVMVYFSSYD